MTYFTNRFPAIHALKHRARALAGSSALNTAPRFATAALWAALIATTAMPAILVAGISEAQAEGLKPNGGTGGNDNGMGTVGYNGSGGGATSGGAAGKVGATQIDSGSNVLTGGAGGAGGSNSTSANIASTAPGGGGGGGAGLFLSSDTSSSTHQGLIITGGKGGVGGTVTWTVDNSKYYGNSGNGGAGAMINGQLTNVQGASIIGGAGGAGSGSKGAGGDGVAVVGEGSRFENFGTVKGGGSSTATSAGAGIRLGHDAYVVNAGIVQPGSTSVSAIQIVGERATLELRAGSDIQGKVSVASTVTDATLVLNTAEDLTLDIGIGGYSGFATVGKTGAGTLTLTGTSAVVLPWHIEEGKLVASVAGSLGAAGGVVTLDGGSLEFGSAFTVANAIELAQSSNVVSTNFINTLSGAIGGVGGLTKEGTGTLILTGANDFVEDLVVNGGAVQIGNGAATGSVSQANIVLNNGNLIVDRSDNYQFDNDVSGSGQLIKNGAGKLIIGANLDHTGGTLINQGTLQLGDGGLDGTVKGAITIASAGTLEFNHSNAEIYQGSLTGSGTLKVDSPGALHLTGDNSGFTGTTAANGTLIVDHKLGSTVNVSATGDLSGSGEILGNTSIASGGTLYGTQGKTLTFDQDLTLATGSVVDAKLSLFDPGASALFDVKGKLTLAGTLNVESLGGLGEGAYRLFDYGTLQNDGFTLGTAPSGVSFVIDTNTANRVLLLSTGGATVSYWDGPNGPSNGQVDGGTGIWSNEASNNSWTTPSGAVNTAWPNDEMAIFSGTGGEVTIVDTYGQVASDGMMFLVDGYTLKGDGLVLTGEGSAKSVVAVGTNTAGSEMITATVENQLLTTAGLNKTGLGTLILAADNSYTGGTQITQGTLQLGNGGNTGSVTGNIVIGSNEQDEAELKINRSDVYTISGTLSGYGALIQEGSGKTILTGENTYMGGSTVNHGELQIGNGGTQGSIEGDVHLAAGTIFSTDLSKDIALDSTISGAGKVVQKGTGVTKLTGHNTYAGGTEITSGVLEIERDHNLGDEHGSVLIDGGELRFAAPATLGKDRTVTLGTNNGVINTNANLVEFGGSVDGAGQLVKTGTGTLVLDGENSYAGGSQVNAGILQIGNGGKTGSIIGNVDVAAGAGFGINRSDDYTFAGTISGDGHFEQTGTGETVLTGINSYKGGTDIKAGVLEVGSNENLGDASGDVRIDGGTLRFSNGFDTARHVTLGANNGSIDTEGNTNKITGVIDGDGSLVKEGTGTLIVTGENSYTGGS
ncbi:autotransporter-associated beta strand repeat-containing protein, partial [Ochrobactrum sp. GPK 3]